MAYEIILLEQKTIQGNQTLNNTRIIHDDNLMVPSETEKTCDKSVHGKIQYRIVATQKD